MRLFVAFAFVLAMGGCEFKPQGLDPNGGVDGDMAFNGGGDDMAGGGDTDLATDATPDLALGPDMMPPNLVVSHVPAHYFTDGTCDLVVTSAIDTTARTVDGAAAPAGCVFASDTEGGSLTVSVLAVHSVAFNNTVTVTGSAPLVVVARTTITVNGILDASANMATAGPGGDGPGGGAGGGPSGAHGVGAMSLADSGGSGGSFGTVGGIGGVGSYMGATPAQTAGVTFNTALMPTTVPGGSGGGNGHSEGCTPAGTGGAGGGSIQLSAGGSIVVAVGGVIDVGGGGGGLGCRQNANDEASGGGGGAGGAIFLESPSVTVNGQLWANGGSGGGGASGSTGDTAGSNGSNAPRSTTPVAGGASGGSYGGAGGAGFAGGTAAAKGGEGGTPTIANGGGGGGGAGRIVVRSRGAATINGAGVSPSAQTDTTIP